MIKRDFKKTDESFNLSEIMDGKSKLRDSKLSNQINRKTTDEDSFNLSEIIDDLDKIQPQNKELYDVK